MPLTPPPDAIFVSMNALLDSTKAHASSHGFTITILCSKKNKEGHIYKIWLKCDQGGRYRARGLTEDLWIWLTATRCTECPFLAIGKLNELGDWILISSILFI